MKKVILSLIVAATASVLVPASAQPGADEANTNQPAGDMTAPDPGALPAGPAAAPVVDPATGLPAADNTADNGAAAPATPGEPTVITPGRRPAMAQGVVESTFMPPEQVGSGAANDLTLHFNQAPLDMVLNYLSDAAGFIVVQEARINSNLRMTVNGKHLTQEEAADLLNSVLNQSGYAAIRDGRTLTIVDKTDAKTRDIPVMTGNDPTRMKKNAEIVTQIIPIRFVDAQQLVSDLSSFVSPQATVVANEAGNSIVITDTQENIRHLMLVIKAVDDSAEAETEIRVFKLEHASPSDVAAELASVFPSSTGNNQQTPIRFGGGAGGRLGGLFGGGGFGGGGFGGGGFGGGGFGGGGGGRGGASATSDRLRKATQVNAVADPRIQAVIVTAPKDLMDEIAGMMKELDVASDRDQQVYVFKMNNGDPQQTAQVLQSMFQGNNSRNTTGQSQVSPLQQRIQNSTTQMGQQSSSGFGSSSFGGGGGRGGAAF
jgi:type II secretory pathway component GspD/PulD (secretin)